MKPIGALTLCFGLGLVFVTTVVSGLDYVLTYSRRAIEVSRRRSGLA